MDEPDDRRTAAHLLLDDGLELVGHTAGAALPVSGEVVFNTAMAGYPETLTDPSYAGQILVLTYPLIGNYGVPAADTTAPESGRLQSRRIQVAGLVVQHLSEHVSHFSACETLGSWCKRHSVPILHGVDTRALTQRLRERGTMQGCLYPGGMDREEAQRLAVGIEMRAEVFHRVAPTETMYYDGGDLKILLVDVGAKEGIVHCLRARGAAVIRAPWHADLASLAGEADGVMISNGPGDPADLGALTDQLRRMLASFAGPIFGICLGHQILARAAGFATYKLKYGHRGVNQPVREAGSGRCFVTSQNHGYAVDVQRLQPGWTSWFENLNDGTNEGLQNVERPHFSVQFHPEGRPGPADTEFLFDHFLHLAGALRAGGSS
ncbi:MAG: glutamine-hydrolyzing carbamoyl-phosphate synthase small subunit [Steroidobacteraceae bacterium]|nr:glutamine-hydrolyzing carbamoyl-phosphate synthase small subunit [Steroidobacteraceae bacterium]